MFTIYDLLKNFIARFYGNMNNVTIWEQHNRVVEAIKQREPEKTRTAILDHLNYVETTIRNALGANGEFQDRGEASILDLE